MECGLQMFYWAFQMLFHVVSKWHPGKARLSSTRMTTTSLQKVMRCLLWQMMMIPMLHLPRFLRYHFHTSFGSAATGVVVAIFLNAKISLLAFSCCCSSCKLLCSFGKKAMGLNVLGNVHIGQLEIHASLSLLPPALPLFFQSTCQICWHSVVVAHLASCYTP